MLPEPSMATLEQIDPDQGKGVHSSLQARYFVPRSPRKIFVQAAYGALLWQANQFPRDQASKQVSKQESK